MGGGGLVHNAVLLLYIQITIFQYNRMRVLRTLTSLLTRSGKQILIDTEVDIKNVLLNLSQDFGH